MSGSAWKTFATVVCSSPYESLSIVLLEGFSLGIPGLVNARSAVLEDHCRSSNGGLFYKDADEFVESLDLLVRGPAALPRLCAPYLCIQVSETTA